MDGAFGVEINNSESMVQADRIVEHFDGIVCDEKRPSYDNTVLKAKDLFAYPQYKDCIRMQILKNSYNLKKGIGKVTVLYNPYEEKYYYIRRKYTLLMESPWFYIKKEDSKKKYPFIYYREHNNISGFILPIQAEE